MKWRRILAVLMLCMLAGLTLNVPNVAHAAMKEASQITPRYLYICEAEASLQISDSGVATCSGGVAVYSRTSDISMRVNLYRQEGNSWYRVTGWGASCEGRYSLSTGGTYTLQTSGTYKVVTTAAIIAENGDCETISVDSDTFTYP